MHISENQERPLTSTPDDENAPSNQEMDSAKDHEPSTTPPLSEVATRINLLGKLIIPPSVP
jgi:hypothetical protein